MLTLIEVGGVIRAGGSLAEQVQLTATSGPNTPRRERQPLQSSPAAFDEARTSMDGLGEGALAASEIRMRGR